MTRDEYLHVLATEPATDTQVGAIHGEWQRLWPDCDRATRLRISAELLGLEELGSTTDLVMGDAGRLVAMLRRTRDRAELPDIAAAAVDEDQGDEHDGDGQAETERITWPEAITRIMVMIYIATQKTSAGKCGSSVCKLPTWRAWDGSNRGAAYWPRNSAPLRGTGRYSPLTLRRKRAEGSRA